MAGDGVLVGLWAVTAAGGRWWSPTELRVSGWVGVRGLGLLGEGRRKPVGGAGGGANDGNSEEG
jgi:hypothetical protein